MQGAQIFRNKAYIEVRRMTKDEVQRSPSTLLRAVSLSNGRWTFYEVVTIKLVSLSAYYLKGNMLY